MTINTTNKPLTIIFVSIAIIFALLSLVVSGLLVKQLAEEERNKMEVWALATQSMIKSEANLDLELILNILQTNTTIPIILHDKNFDRYVAHNIKLPIEGAKPFLKKKIEKFKNNQEPIVLEEMNQILYYDDSYTLKRLQLYPYLQLIVISLFIALAFVTLNRSWRAEQDRVWVGLSKETAHQLGTPVSSLMAWSEYLKLKELDEHLLVEIDKDVARLQMITDRFSKIGSDTLLQPETLQEVVNYAVTYMEKRVSERVLFNLTLPDEPIIVMLNKPLFSWVIENLTKNAVDAMKGEGEIFYLMTSNSKYVFLEITDNGKGIPKSKFKTIFTPGYTSKERGWGLGLSLVKRIIEVNHKGRIYVKESQEGLGTTFRIQLKK